MKGWIKTGFLGVVIYFVVFLFNRIFLNQIPDNIIIQIVNAPVYFLLQLFGIVSAGFVVWIGIVSYFILGVVLFFIVEGLDVVSKKYGLRRENV